MDFRVLGRIELVTDAGEAIPVTRPLSRATLFSLVLYRNRALSAERLVDLLWGAGAQAGRRLHSLRSCIWNLRQVIPPNHLISDGLGYRLTIDPARDQVDMDRFRALHRQGRAALGSGAEITAIQLLAEAVEIWGAGRLSDLLPATPAMSSLITGLVEERRNARNTLIRTRLTQGQHGELLPELRALIIAEPEDEALWGYLMLALYRCGLKSDALNAFAQARVALATHAAAVPSSDLRLLRRRIHDDDPGLYPAALAARAAAPPASAAARRGVLPRQIPTDLADFTARGEEAAELIALLSPAVTRSAVPVAEVIGPPGIGKTALAVHVAHAIAHDYPDGQLYVQLPGLSLTPPLTGTDLGDLLRTLGVPAGEIPETAEQRAAVYRSRLAGLRMLIVIDDAAAPDQVRPFLPGTAGSAVIITSRTRLVGLASGRSVNLTPLDHTNALQLLVRSIGPLRIAAEPVAADFVVSACGGFPLAVRIAAERLAARPGWPITHLAHTLENPAHRLNELVAGDLSVQASFDLSYRALQPSARRLFRRLAIPGPHPITGEVADRLLGEPAAEAIDLLVDHCLLETAGTDTSGLPRYHLHGLLRDYATTLLDNDPDAGLA